MAAGAFGRARNYGWDSPFEYLVIGVSCCSHPATEWVCIRKVNIVATVCCIVLLVLLVFISIITLAVRMRYTILKLSYKNIYKNICKNGNVSLFVCTPFCGLLSQGLNANKVPCRFPDLDYKFLIKLYIELWKPITVLPGGSLQKLTFVGCKFSLPQAFNADKLH